MIPLASFVYKYYPDGKKIIPEDQDSDAYRKKFDICSNVYATLG